MNMVISKDIFVVSTLLGFKENKEEDFVLRKHQGMRDFEHRRNNSLSNDEKRNHPNIAGR